VKAPDLVTIALIAAAVYLLWTAARGAARQPRLYYTAAEGADWWA